MNTAIFNNRVTYVPRFDFMSGFGVPSGGNCLTTPSANLANNNYSNTVTNSGSTPSGGNSVRIHQNHIISMPLSAASQINAGTMYLVNSAAGSIKY